jgi:hypothetical protein
VPPRVHSLFEGRSVSRFRRSPAFAALALILACATPPQDERCRTQPGEGALEIECPPEEDEDAWSRRAEEEAREGMRERTPGSRP